MSASLQDARLSVIDVFKGDIPAEVWVEINPGTCHVRFESGRTYLVFLNRTSGRYDTSTCARTRPVEHAGEDLKYLRGLRAGVALPVLSGEVLRRIETITGVQMRWPGESFDVVAMNGSEKFTVATDVGGAFDLVLQPGVYLVWVEKNGTMLTHSEYLPLRAGDVRNLGVIGVP